MADLDSGDEWLNELLQRPRRTITTQDDDAEASLFLAELLVAHHTRTNSDLGLGSTAHRTRGLPTPVCHTLDLLAGADRSEGPRSHTRPPTASGELLADVAYRTTTNSDLAGAAHRTRGSPLRARHALDRTSAGTDSSERPRRDDCSGHRGCKRARRSLLRPPTASEAHSLQTQHAETLALVGHDSAIIVSLCRCFFNMAASDLTVAALGALADSLAYRIAGLVGGVPPPVFKVGLTRCPRWRFREAPFAHFPTFDKMEVLAAGFVELVRFLEEAVISRVRMLPGCQNVAPGGETPPPPSIPCYLYCVQKPVEAVVADRLRAVRQGRRTD